MNDTEKANMNTRKLCQHLVKLRQKNKNTSTSFGGRKIYPFLSSLMEIVPMQRKMNEKSSHEAQDERILRSHHLHAPQYS